MKTRACVAQTHEDRATAAQHCDDLLVRMLKMMDTLRDDDKRKKNLAAMRIQKLFRTHKAWRRMRTVFRMTWNQVFDPERGVHYYVNRRDGRTVWNRPMLVGVPVSISEYPERLFDEMSQEEAIAAIVGLFRRTAAQKITLAMAKSMFKIVRDPNTGSKYYYNNRTGESTWVRPKLLGPERVKSKQGKTRRTGRKLSQRSSTRNRSVRSSRSGRSVAKHGATRSKIRVGRRSQDMSQIDAVIKLQAWARWCLSRSHVWSLVEIVFEKVYDPGNDAFFYFNSRTETSSWVKPKLFGQKDLAESRTERTVMTGRQVSGRAMVRTARRAENMTQNEAATKIGAFLKLAAARRRLANQVLEVWEPVWDESQQEFYFFNKETEESVWDKPALLVVVNAAWSRKGRELLQPAKQSVPLHFAQGVRSSRRSEKLSRAKAAIVCQSFARFILGRQRMQARALEVFEKCIDPDYLQPYYFDKRSFESSWEKPAYFWNWDLPVTADDASLSLHMRNTGAVLPRLGRRKQDLNEAQAALMVQKMFRMRKGWRYAIRQARMVLEKVWSDEFQAFYYHNKRTDESTWEKPILLGEQDLMPTPRSHAAAVQAGIEPIDGPLSRNGVRLTPRGTNFILGPLSPPPKKLLGTVRQAEQMSEDEACIRIQSTLRACRARRQVRKLIKTVYEKVLDADSGDFYFYNTNTGESTWEEPIVVQKLLGSGHTLDETPRDHSLAVRFKARPTSRKPRTGRRAGDLTPKLACIKIQSTARMWSCRQNVIAVVQARVRKCFHGGFGAFFYYDTRRHSATWFKPVILRRADIRETAESDLAQEVRRLLPGLANAPDDFALSAAAPQTGLPAIAELSSSEASRITTARSTSSSIAAAAARPLSAVPSWRPNLNDDRADSPTALNLQLTDDKIRSLHLRELRMFALSHRPELGPQVEVLFDEHKEGVWDVLAKRTPASVSYAERVEESKKLTLKRLEQAVQSAIRGQTGLTSRVVEAEVSAASAVAAARRASQEKRSSLRALASSIRANRRTVTDPNKRIHQASHFEAAVKALPAGTELWTAPIKELDEGEETDEEALLPLSSRRTTEVHMPEVMNDADAALGAARHFFASLGAQSSSTTDKFQGSLLGTSASSVLKMKRSIEASTPRPAIKEANAMAIGSQTAAEGTVSRRAAFEAAMADVPLAVPASTGSHQPATQAAQANEELHKAKVTSTDVVNSNIPGNTLGTTLAGDSSSKLASSSQLTQTLRSYASDVDVVTRILDYDSIVARWARRFDADEGRFFYLSHETGETSWDRPAEILEFAIPLSPRTQMAYDIFERKRRVSGLDRRKTAEHLSAEEAALTIQCATRCAKAAKLAKFKAQLVYKKAFDEGTGGSYYWNPRTERSAWIKPKLLGADDVRMTPRTRLPDGGMANPDGQKPKVVQALNSTRALTVVQCFVRLLKARRVARLRCRQIMQKVIDDETAYPYYFNTVTGESQWHKPLILGDEDLDISAVSARQSLESLKS